MNQDRNAAALDRLIAIMARLRNPQSGCPWDMKQSFATIAPYTIEEAYEVAEAAERLDMPHLKEELGDLLLQVVFHSRMAEEQGSFAFADVAEAISGKMEHRHPHVFGPETGRPSVTSAGAQTTAWEDLKAKERQAKSAAQGLATSALDGVGTGMPALTRAEKLQKRAARVGFDWPDALSIHDKIDEENLELKVEVQANSPPDRLTDELGDLLFSVVNLARRLDIDPEQALRGACRKFERRFRTVERHLADQGLTPKGLDIDRLEDEWRRAKALEAQTPGGPKPPSGD